MKTERFDAGGWDEMPHTEVSQRAALRGGRLTLLPGCPAVNIARQLKGWKVTSII